MSKHTAASTRLLLGHLSPLTSPPVAEEPPEELHLHAGSCSSSGSAHILFVHHEAAAGSHSTSSSSGGSWRLQTPNPEGWWGGGPSAGSDGQLSATPPPPERGTFHSRVHMLLHHPDPPERNRGLHTAPGWFPPPS